MRIRGAGAGVVIGLVLLSTVAGAATTKPACKPAKLSATFRLIPSSHGAGQVFYRLAFNNHGHRACSLGHPRLQLFDQHGASLPSHSRTYGPAVTLRPGAVASAPVKFTPDVAATKESQKGPCEPLAYSIKVTFPGVPGSLSTAVKPPTPVCQYGQMGVNAFKVKATAG